jgi:hypothetical protein
MIQTVDRLSIEHMIQTADRLLQNNPSHGANQIDNCSTTFFTMRQNHRTMVGKIKL